MRKWIAWLGVATLCVLTSSARAQNDVLKPYVVLILDTSGSMNRATGSGPTSCGRQDQYINHAVCAINNIVNSYGDMVFSLARFRETKVGSTGATQVTCDSNGDQDGNPNATIPTPGGGDVCSTQGAYCGDCNPSTGSSKTCTANGQCNSGTCLNPTTAESNCTNTIDDDNDSRVNDGCAALGATENTTFNGVNGCTNNIDDDNDGRINDGCPTVGQCQFNASVSCTTADSNFEVLTPLVDGNNATAAEFTNGSCNTCTMNQLGTLDPEIWGVSPYTFTPLAATLSGSKRYWQGLQASDNTVIWGNTLAGFDPINRDPSNAVFLPTSTCDPSLGCTGANCCTEQCRPYINILLTDGDETCTTFSNTTAAAAALLNTQARNDAVQVSVFSRASGVVTIDTGSAVHPFTVGDAFVVAGSPVTSLNSAAGTYYTVKAVLSATSFTFDLAGSNIGATSGTGSMTVAHFSTLNRYRIETKVIGFGMTPGDPEIEAMAQAGGATDIVGNEGYYANDEADLQLAISQILADSVRSESCNTLDDDCDTRVDEDFSIGVACQAKWPANDPLNPGQVAVGICANTGITQCTVDKTNTECSASPNPRGTEGPGCNQLDDDCDGRVDENLSCQNCQPTGEVCDTDDDSCDTVADMTCTCNAASSNAGAICQNSNAQCPGGACVCVPIVRGCSITNSFGSCAGTQQCDNTTGGVYTNCAGQTPAAELCNAFDDDCDGVCDGFDVGCSEIVTACDPAVPGSCPATNNPGHPSNNPIPQNMCQPGVRTCPQKCGGGNQFGFCSGEVKPQTEACNGLDDDCDNKIDEGTGGAACDTACGVGVTVCTNGTITCTATTGTTDSTCDNKDDDCDNKIDEDWKCANNPDPITGKCSCGTGAVCAGYEACEAGQVVCKGDPIGVETCNCKDDNCNNMTDEGQICPQGAVCTNCQCAYPCAAGEFPCPLGKKCEVSTTDNNKYCVNDPCFNVPCPSMNGKAQTCIPKPDKPNEPQCVDTCSQITCTNGFVCIDATGTCEPNNCTTFPSMCSSNQSCINGTCVTNPCQGVTCDSGTYCVNGACVESCADKECPAGQRCRLGQCETDPCAQGCPYGYSCNDDTGKCIEDPCKTRICDPGQWCNPNSRECETDPCVESNVKCPNAGEICRGGTCIDPDTIAPDAGDEAHVTVGGGGGCSTSGGTSSGIVLLLALMIARRKRVRVGREGGAQ